MRDLFCPTGSLSPTGEPSTKLSTHKLVKVSEAERNENAQLGFTLEYQACPIYNLQSTTRFS